MIDTCQAGGQAGRQGENHNEFTSPASQQKPEVGESTHASQVQGEGQLRFSATVLPPSARYEHEYLTCAFNVRDNY